LTSKRLFQALPPDGQHSSRRQEAFTFDQRRLQSQKTRLESTRNISRSQGWIGCGIGFCFDYITDGESLEYEKTFDGAQLDG
jgi:hypothetical protein